MISSPPCRVVCAVLLALVGCGDDGGGAGGSTGGSDESGTETPSTSTATPGTDATTGMDGTDGSSSGVTSVADTGTDDTGTTGDPPEGGRDLDGDGLADIVIGTRGTDDFTGALWVWYGANGVDLSSTDNADAQVSGTRLGQNLGLASAACDLDDDGTDDLLGASLDGVHVYWGGQTLDDASTEDLLIEGAFTVIRGLRCADVTGDGIDDVVAVGADFTSWMVTVIPGGAGLRDETTIDPAVEPGVVVIDGSDDTLIPQIAVGDLNGDDTYDILVGAERHPLGDPNPPGAAFVFFGGAGLASGTEADADVTVLGENPGGRTGRQVSAADLDGDGIDDWVVGARHEVDLYLGAPDLSLASVEPPLGAAPAPVLAEALRKFAVFPTPDGPEFGNVVIIRGEGLTITVDLDDEDESIYRVLRPYVDDDTEVCIVDAPRKVRGYSIRDVERLGLKSMYPDTDVIMSDHGLTALDFTPDGPGGLSMVDTNEGECVPENRG